MDCQSLMAPIKVNLYADEPAGKTIDFMVEKHMGLVPVTERDGTFTGLISGDSMMGFMLPRAVTNLSKGKGRLTSARFLNETAEEMQGRFNSLRGMTTGELTDRMVATVKPTAPIIDALLLITDKQYVVPVVDDDNKLLGAISFFSVLYGLREEYDRETVQKAKEEERAERKRLKDATEKGRQ